MLKLMGIFDKRERKNQKRIKTEYETKKMDGIFFSYLENISG